MATRASWPSGRGTAHRRRWAIRPNYAEESGRQIGFVPRAGMRWEVEDWLRSAIRMVHWVRLAPDTVARAGGRLGSFRMRSGPARVRVRGSLGGACGPSEAGRAGWSGHDSVRLPGAMSRTLRDAPSRSTRKDRREALAHGRFFRRGGAEFRKAARSVRRGGAAIGTFGGQGVEPRRASALQSRVWPRPNLPDSWGKFDAPPCAPCRDDRRRGPRVQFRLGRVAPGGGGTGGVRARRAALAGEACFGCHGPDKQKGGLRLDRKAEALEGGDGGPVIVAGQGRREPARPARRRASIRTRSCPRRGRA